MADHDWQPEGHRGGYNATGTLQLVRCARCRFKMLRNTRTLEPEPPDLLDHVQRLMGGCDELVAGLVHES